MQQKVVGMVAKIESQFTKTDFGTFTGVGCRYNRTLLNLEFTHTLALTICQTGVGVTTRKLEAETIVRDSRKKIGQTGNVRESRICSVRFAP